MTDESNWGFNTRQVQAGTAPDPATGARALPIYQTAAYVFKDADQAAGRFGLTDPGQIYARITNPTTDAVEKRLASLDNGVGALLVASGQAASFYAIATVAETGDNIVSSASLYGGTYNLLAVTLPQFGITTTFVDDPHNLDEWRNAIKPNTKALYAETIPNPKTDIPDIEEIAKIAHEAGIPLIIDNTVATPYITLPIDFGADVVVYSATKYLNGHGTGIGGAIVDGGHFDYSSGKFPRFTNPDVGYHGLVIADALGGKDGGPNTSFISRARIDLLRDLGAVISPTNAFYIEQGLETLSLRLDRHLSNALKVAEWLEARDDVKTVNYASLPSSPYHQYAVKYTAKGSGGVLSFDLNVDDPKLGLEAGKAFINNVKLFSLLANIGDAKSLIIHPASTTHSQLTPEEQALSGVSPSLIRLSIGLEDIEDLLADLELGFQAADAVLAGETVGAAAAATA